MVFIDIFFSMGRKHLCGSVCLYMSCSIILHILQSSIFTDPLLLRQEWTLRNSRGLFSFGFWNTWLKLVPLWKRMSQIVIEKTRHYLIPDSTWCFLVVIYNPQFPLVDQRHEMCFWPIVCFLEPAGTASFRMVTPYAFKVFNLYYHNEIPWLSKSLLTIHWSKTKSGLYLYCFTTCTCSRAILNFNCRMLNSFFCAHLSQQLTPAQPIAGTMASFGPAQLCKTE